MVQSPDKHSLPSPDAQPSNSLQEKLTHLRGLEKAIFRLLVDSPVGMTEQELLDSLDFNVGTAQFFAAIKKLEGLGIISYFLDERLGVVYKISNQTE